MVWELGGRRRDILAAMGGHRSEKCVRLKVKPSRQLLARLLDMTDVREMRMTRGILRTMPAKVRAALEKAGVKLVMLERRAGRPARYKATARARAVEMAREGKTAAEISGRLGVPATAVYYWRWAERKKGKEDGAAAATPSLDST